MFLFIPNFIESSSVSFLTNKTLFTKLRTINVYPLESTEKFVSKKKL